MSLATHNSIYAGGGPQRWRELISAATHRYEHLLVPLLRNRVVFVVHNSEEAIDALGLGFWHDLDFGVLEAGRLSQELTERFQHAGISLVFLGTGSMLESDSADAMRPGRISVLTSGTTGPLKLVEHTWQTLNTLVKVRESQPRFWFVPYQPGSYAWYQMLCLGAFTPGQDLFCGSPADPVASFSDALAVGVTAVSSTPTFWRYVYLNLDAAILRNAKLDTISLGGETVDQALLDQLRATFPNASIRHIYASSEAGAAIVVTDGRAGFPVSRLTQTGTSLQLKVEDGKLLVRSPFTMAAAAGKPDAWIDTGDLVEVRGDRVYFLGREGASMINVGGMKAFPADIESRLMLHPNVCWAQVYARKAPLVGMLPAVRVVLREPSANRAHDEAELSSFLRQSLSEHAVPRFWDFMTDIPLKASLKS